MATAVLPSEPPIHAPVLPSLDSFDCPVCLDLMVQPVCASCGHDFCKFCYEAWVGESGMERPVCPVCRQHISSDCPGVCRRMESTISVLFPHELSARTAEVELHKRQRAELQANEAANRSEARRRLYSRIVSILERLRGSVTDELEQQQRAGAESPIENNNTSANTTTRVGTATQAQPEAASAGTQTAGPLEEDRGAAPGPRLGGPGGPPEGFDAPAAALARTLDNFMSSAMSSNAWQEGPPLLTLVFTIGRDGEDTPNESPAAPRRIPPHMLSSWRSAMAQNRARRGEAQGAQNPPRRSARLRNRRLPPGVPPFEEDAGDEGGEQ